MALTPSSNAATEMQAVPNKYKDRDTSPERNKVWTEPNSKLKLHNNGVRKYFVVPVIYYLSRNGQLEHPHFIEVPLSSSQGLFLRDVINRLNFLRGKGMANHYSWSAKRSYKNGYVWHDLEDNDFIQPVHGQEYILKGSEILEESSNFISNSSESPSSSSSGKQMEITTKPDVVEPEFPVRNRRRNQSLSSINLHEYKVYKSEYSGELAGKAAADASTQTDEKRHRRRQAAKETEILEEEEPVKSQEEDHSTELSRAEISPPPVDSSPETLESLMKAGGGRLLPSLSSIQTFDRNSNRMAGEQLPGGGKMKPSSILASLISCGSISFRDCGSAAGKDHGFSLISHYKSRLPRVDNQTVDDTESVNSSAGIGKMVLEDKEYFSGSLVETRRDEFPSLKRSSSYNADRKLQLKLGEKEIEGVRAKCIPRRPKAPYPPPSKNSTAINGNNNNYNAEV
ncbi:hypothetical protein V2J09_019049 [Rumex salicifolius]